MVYSAIFVCINSFIMTISLRDNFSPSNAFTFNDVSETNVFRNAS
ncbi:hypothetical protein D7V82_22135 [bacterium 1xD8-6]|nr:hypothetical protein D7V72_21855 [bacterium D16-36]RKI61802.1 hypothetical protein D7V82_22135 [bacterium 1xD8-6]